MEVGDGERDVPEGERAERGRQRQRDGLGQVRADELVGTEDRVEEEQQHDHQRPRAHRGHADHEAARATPMATVGQRPHDELADQALAALARATVEPVAQHHGAGAEQQRGTEEDLHRCARPPWSCPCRCRA